MLGAADAEAATIKIGIVGRVACKWPNYASSASSAPHGGRMGDNSSIGVHHQYVREDRASASSNTTQRHASTVERPTARDSDDRASLLGHLLRRHGRAWPARGGPLG